MGTRYFLQLDCAYCHKPNLEVYYAPSCGFLSFKCDVCGKENWVREGFFAEPITAEESEKRHFLEGFFDETPYLPPFIGKCSCISNDEVRMIDNLCPNHGREAQIKAIKTMKEKYGITEGLFWEDCDKCGKSRTYCACG